MPKGSISNSNNQTPLTALLSPGQNTGCATVTKRKKERKSEKNMIKGAM